MQYEDSKAIKFQEGIMIILEYSIAREIQLTEIFQYLNTNFEDKTLIKKGMSQQLTNYLLGIPKLQNLCRILQLKYLDYRIQETINKPFDKKLLYFKLFQLINTKPNYIKSIPQQSIIQDIEMAQKPQQITYQQQQSDKEYALNILNHLAESYESFPQILCAIHLEINNNELYFNLDLNAKFMQSLRNLELDDCLKPVNYELDEVGIIEKILFHTNQYIKSDHIAYYNDDYAKQLYSQINEIEYSKYKRNIIFERLVKLQNSIKSKTNQRGNHKFNQIALAAYLLEYVNFNQIYPDLIRHLSIRRLSSFNTVLTYRTHPKFLEDIQRNPIVYHLNDNNYNENVYSKLEMQYPEFTYLKNIDGVIAKMLKLIFSQKTKIKEHLINLFSQKKVYDLMIRIKQLDKNIIKQESFQTLLQLEAYTMRFDVVAPQVKDIIFDTYNEKQRAKQNMKLALKMMVEKDVVIPELIGYLVYSRSKNKLPEVTITTHMRVHNFFQSDQNIINLLESYGVQKNERYMLLNIDPSQINLNITCSESVCIINRLEAIDREKYRLKQQLYDVFQYKQVRDLMRQLEECNTQYKGSTLLQAILGYNVLKNIATVFQDLESQSESEEDLSI